MSKQKRKRELDAAVAARVQREIGGLFTDLAGISDYMREHVNGVPKDAGLEDQLDALINIYSVALIAERDAILDAVVDRIVALAERAKQNEKGVEAGIVHELGDAARGLVLNGALHQQVVCTVAARLALKSGPALDVLAPQLIRALVTVLQVGAPTTRDSAVEGLGGLLRHTPSAAMERLLPQQKAPPGLFTAEEEKDESTATQRRAATQYFQTLNRRRMMALATAGQPDCLRDFTERLRPKIADVIDQVRRDSSHDTVVENLVDVLSERADLLRTLTAMLRQRTPDISVETAVRHLHDAAHLRRMRQTKLDDRKTENVIIAHARFQESVFSTMSVMIRRNLATSEFDSVIASAVEAIPLTIVGSASVCNAIVRATIAIISAAARLIEHDTAVNTRVALTEIFKTLAHERPSLWLNVGIDEGCYRVLPYLIVDDHNDELTIPALKTLFQHLHRRHDAGDFFETHRQLIAGECFRHLLIRLAESDRGRHEVQRLLLHADADTVRAVFQKKGAPPHTGGRLAHYSLDEAVIAGVAFESSLLKRSAAIFGHWSQYTAAERAILTRILAAELRASSRDMRELARYSALLRLYAHLPTVSIPDEERLNSIWALLAALPPEAAGAADADLQEFINHCGRRNRSRDRAHDTEDLPGHILAMISDAPSRTIADAIAREIDLNLRHERLHAGEDADFARALYQVTLRGPDLIVFDQLRPRMQTEEDVELVRLFRRHVETVQASWKAARLDPFDMQPLLNHVTKMRADIGKAQPTLTLNKLDQALELYHNIAVNDPSVWNTLAEKGTSRGGLGLLFRLLDAVDHDGPTDEEKRVADRSAPSRASLEKAYFDLATQLRTEVVHYLELPIGEFDERAAALKRARDIVLRIETALPNHRGLQPPERILLVALMQHLRILFDRTIHWWCEEPRRRKEAGDEAAFWFFFTRPWKVIRSHHQSWLAAAAKLELGKTEAALQYQMLKDIERNMLDRLKRSYGPEPPPFEQQHDYFERFYVEWMAADLRVDTLEARLTEKNYWSRSFRAGYWMVTRPRFMAALIVVPCVVAAVLHLVREHAWEGVAHFVIATLTVLVAILTFLPGVRAFARRVLRRGTQPQYYRFQAMLPRLARLIAVPMALIVELDHSYHFSMNGSTWALLLLITMAYLSTRLFITREILNAGEAKDADVYDPDLRDRARRVLSVAMAHSFAIAMLFAIIFASATAETIQPHSREFDPPPTTGSRLFFFVDKVYRHLDVIPKGHRFPSFLGVIPRDASFDLTAILHSFHWQVAPGLAAHLHFVFYPTIILTWSALGLFVGVVFEGFVGGKRLRGSSSEERE